MIAAIKSNNAEPIHMTVVNTIVTITPSLKIDPEKYTERSVVKFSDFPKE
jgi:hypothetical protein